MITKRITESQHIQTTINIFTGIFVLVFNMGVNFFVSPYLVMTLGEEANGYTQLANNFVTYASLITIAFNSMSGRFITVCYHRNDLNGVNKYFSSTMVCNGIITAVLVPAAITVILKLERIICIENADIKDVKALFTCVFLNFFICLLTSVYGISMFVKNAIYIQNIISLLRSIINASLLLIVYTLFPPKLFYVPLVTLGLSFIVSIINFFIHIKLMPDLKFNFSYFDYSAVKDMLASGIWNAINQCGNLLMTGLDLIVTNILVDPLSMGVLAVAKTVPTTIVSLATTLNVNFAPALTIDWAK